MGLKLLKIKNLGLPKSINLALRQSLGRYIVRVDSDDYVSRNFYFLVDSFKYE